MDYNSIWLFIVKGDKMKKEIPEEKEKVDEEKYHDDIEDESQEPSDKIEEEMEEGKHDEEVYTEEGREKLVEDDEIEDWEEGFMKGAEGRGKGTSCAFCGKMISEDKEGIVEREIDGEIKVFCSEEHAIKYSQKHQK